MVSIRLRTKEHVALAGHSLQLQALSMPIGEQPNSFSIFQSSKQLIAIQFPMDAMVDGHSEHGTTGKVTHRCFKTNMFTLEEKEDAKLEKAMFRFRITNISVKVL